MRAKAASKKGPAKYNTETIPEKEDLKRRTTHGFFPLTLSEGARGVDVLLLKPWETYVCTSEQGSSAETVTAHEATLSRLLSTLCETTYQTRAKGINRLGLMHCCGFCGTTKCVPSSRCGVDVRRHTAKDARESISED